MNTIKLAKAQAKRIFRDINSDIARVQGGLQMMSEHWLTSDHEIWAKEMVHAIFIYHHYLCILMTNRMMSSGISAEKTQEVVMDVLDKIVEDVRMLTGMDLKNPS